MKTATIKNNIFLNTLPPFSGNIQSEYIDDYVSNVCSQLCAALLTRKEDLLP